LAEIFLTFFEQVGSRSDIKYCAYFKLIWPFLSYYCTSPYLYIHTRKATATYLAVVINVGFGRDFNSVAMESIKLSIISKELT